MKVFQTVQKKFTILGIYATQTNRKRPFNLKILLVYLICGSGWMTSTTFLIYKANTFEEYANVVYISTALTVVSFVFTVAVFSRERMFRFMDSCGNIVDREPKLFDNESSKSIYSKTDRLLEKWSAIGYFIIAEMSPICCVWPKAMVCYFIYFTTNSGNDSFSLVMYGMFPFDWKNPIGYLVVTTVECITAMYVLRIAACLMLLGIGFFLFILSMTEDAKANLQSIKKNIKIKANQTKALLQIGGFIRFHSSLKQLNHDFVEVYQPIFMIICTWSLVTICGVMLLLQIGIEDNAFVMLSLTLIFACYAFGVTLIFCELGQRITDAFPEIGDTIENFDWYSFPIEIQRMLPIIMMAAQQEVFLECFGSISGTRETFKRVIKSGFSYFMVIRQFME